MSTIQKLVLLIQYTIVALLVLLIFQMITTVSYNVFVLFLIVGLSYTLAVAMLGLLAQRFFSWFKSNRNIVVLSYGLASVALSVNAAFTMAYVGDLFTNQPGYVSPHILHISMAPSTNSVPQSRIRDILHYLIYVNMDRNRTFTTPPF